MTGKNQTCCFTGHRMLSNYDIEKIKKHLPTIITNLINNGVRYFGVGGAIGFDTIAALNVIDLRKSHPEIKLISVLPCKSQNERWNEKDKEIYKEIINNSDKVVYTSEVYFKGCMHKRNRHLVDNSGYCICYLTRTQGGTAYTVDYALERGLPVINIADY